jgi:DNA-directed RNA polymerase specialized sigma24 family protein
MKAHALAEAVAEHQSAAQEARIIVDPPLALMGQVAREAVRAEMAGRNMRTGFSPCVDEEDLAQEAMIAMLKVWRSYVGPHLQETLHLIARQAVRGASRREGCAGRIRWRHIKGVSKALRPRERGESVDYTEATLTTRPIDVVEEVLDVHLVTKNAGLSQKERVAYERRVLGHTLQEIASYIGVPHRRYASRIIDRGAKKVAAFGREGTDGPLNSLWRVKGAETRKQRYRGAMDQAALAGSAKLDA